MHIAQQRLLMNLFLTSLCDSCPLELEGITVVALSAKLSVSKMFLSIYGSALVHVKHI